MSETTNEVATRRFTDDELRNITNANQAWALATERDGEPELLSSVIGNGFEVLNDKNFLVGKPFLILDWHFSNGKQGEFVSILLVTNDGGKYIINDGSTGILKQMHDVGAVKSYIVKSGLRVSRYQVTLTNTKTGEDYVSDAETYYLAV